MIDIFLIFTIFSFFIGIFIGICSFYFEVSDKLIINKIDKILPQIQCKKCNHSGCFPYAEAIVMKKENINKCIPGGKKVFKNLSKLIDNKNFFSIKIYERKIAWIDEENCIGCTKCTKLCPVDAIVGSKKTIHTIIERFCTGCELCISPCPTNCIKIKKIKNY